MSVLQCTHCDLCCPNHHLTLLHNQPLGHNSLAYICIITCASLHALSLKYSYLTRSLNESQNLTMLVFCNQYFQIPLQLHTCIRQKLNLRLEVKLGVFWTSSISCCMLILQVRERISTEWQWLVQSLTIRTTICNASKLTPTVTSMKLKPNCSLYDSTSSANLQKNRLKCARSDRDHC